MIAMKKLVSVLILGLMCASQLRGSVRVADPRAFPYVMQHAHITVLFDGKPLAGAHVEVSSIGIWNLISSLTTDSNGQTTLPALPDGAYQVNASSDRNPGTSAGKFIRIGACPECFEVVDLTMDSLDGDVKPVEVDFGVREFSIDVGPFPSPDQIVSAALNQLPSHNVRELKGTVTDRTGASIRGAWIGVVRRAGQGYEEVELIRADEKGDFAADLPEGNYFILVTAQGFQV